MCALLAFSVESESIPEIGYPLICSNLFLCIFLGWKETGMLSSLSFGFSILSRIYCYVLLPPPTALNLLPSFRFALSRYDCVALEASTFNRPSFASLSECYIRLVNADTNQVWIFVRMILLNYTRKCSQNSSFMDPGQEFTFYLI